MSYGNIEKLSAEHDVSFFNCGKSSQNDWLRRLALTNQRSDSARTYVSIRGLVVTGYYSLCAGAIRVEEAPRQSR